LKVCLIGYGKLGSSIAKGLRNAGVEVTVSTLPPTDEWAREDGFSVVPMRACAEGVDLIIVAVPPSAVPAVMKELRGVEVPITSTAALVKLGELKKYADKVYRVMPSVTVEVNSSPVLVAERGGGADSVVEAVWGKLGKVYWVNERVLDAALPVVGSGPAVHAEYFRSAVEALVASGVERSLAEELARESIIGTIKMLEKYDPYKLRSKVETPGGITVEMLLKLEEEGVFGKIAKVLGEKGRELSR